MTVRADFIVMDLPSVLILIIAIQILNDLCVVLTHTTDVYLDSWVKKFILPITFLINLSEICLIQNILD